MDFDPVPLTSPPLRALTSGPLESLVRQWATSPPLRALAEASGWAWPGERDTRSLLARLADLSADWDFRAGRERNFIESEPATVKGRVVPDELVAAAARALGMVNAGPPPAGPFSALVVLTGLVSACVNRTRLAARLLRGGLVADAAVVLAAHRELAGKEPAQAAELGLGDLIDEVDVVVAATSQAFGVGAPDTAEAARSPEPAWDNALWGASARYRWAARPGRPDLQVIVGPSSDPAQRRANTADQLRHWARLSGITSSDRVLLVTTQIYVPFQHFDALRVLGLEHGCAVACHGVDARTAYLPMRRFGGRDYMQEIRSALLAASSLLAAARQSGH